MRRTNDAKADETLQRPPFAGLTTTSFGRTRELLGTAPSLKHVFATRAWIVWATTSPGELLHDVTKCLIAVAPEVAWVTARVLAELLEQVQLRLDVPVDRSWSRSYNCCLASAVSVAEALTLQLELFTRSLWH